MSDETSRIGLPMLAAGQAQKEVTHNEALLRLDMLVHAGVEAMPLTTPPSNPVAGQCWIVGTGATNQWQGRDKAVAQWTESGWRFIEAFDGLSAWCRPTRRLLRFSQNQWSDVLDTGPVRIDGKQIIGPQQAAIAAPTGGTVIDVQARATISALLMTMRAHGLISN